MSLELSVDTNDLFPRSDLLYMQFMEPLGTSDSSVEAAWDSVNERWKPEFIDTLRDLAPGCIRWGGCYTSYWKWREGIGPREGRVPAYNFLWDGMETNHVGIHEIVDLCNQVGSEPLIGINFAADGRPEYINPPVGATRSGDALEAADLVTYCNDPDSAERRQNGAKQPWNVKLWQIGNETSYPREGKRFTREQNTEHYIEFAKAMRDRDPSICLIGWGDKTHDGEDMWAGHLIEGAGELVDMVAVHMMNQRATDSEPLLFGRNYMNDRAAAWDQLQNIYRRVDEKLSEIVSAVSSSGSDVKIAITEGHLSLKPHNTNLMLYEWIAGLYNARLMNLFERHADLVEISALADFFGNRWTVNAVMLGSPRQSVFLMPVATIMKVFSRYSGSQGLRVPAQLGSLDLSASRNDDRLFLHVANCGLGSAETATIRVPG